MGRLINVATALILALSAHVVWAETEIARLSDDIVVQDDGGVVEMVVPLTAPVPWKVWLANDPPRLVLEITGVDLGEMPEVTSQSIATLTTERHSPNQSRIIAYLREPLLVDTAEMVTAEDGSAALLLSFATATGAEFQEAAKPLDEPEEPPVKTRPVVVIDPGHGGRDPGADAAGQSEADLMLEFALRLRIDLQATGVFNVVLTRDADIFVPLDTRLTLARAADADVFLSLHADRLQIDAGQASGMTVYTLADNAFADADDRQSQRNGADDILKGVDLSGTGDQVARALMALQRQDTDPRTSALSSTLVQAFTTSGLTVNSRPERQGNFSVLKAADIPSALIELGFLSSEKDLERLKSESWQVEAALAIRDGLLQWYQEDVLLEQALRK